MATNTLAQRLKINGLIDTNQDVVSNMERIARNATSWLGYDTATGKWAVVINKAGSSVHSFNDSNIIGPISVTGKDVTELFNRAEIKYPLRDSADKTDTIVLETPAADRNAFEKDKTLNITYDMVNEPVQAQLLGLIELKQSRIDTIVEFTADYSTINVQAGDIIDITNEHLGYTNKLFRVASLEEAEGDGGAIVVRYQCLEYDADIYDETALTRYIRTDRTNIASLGYIEDPDTAPVVSVTSIDDVPYHEVTMNVPIGIVTELELWVSFDNTNWDLNHTVFPKDYGDDKVTMIPDDNITVRRPYLTIPREAALGEFTPTGSYTVYWKYRGKNTQNWSAFSSVTAVTWDPVVTSTGQWVESVMINPTTGNVITSTTGNSWTAGQAYGTSMAQKGQASQTQFQNQSGIPLENKDTDAPISKNIDNYILVGNTSVMLGDVNTWAGTANMAGYQGSSTSYGSNVYQEVRLGLNYGFKSAQFNTQLPGGYYDYETWDPVANAAVTVEGLGYVPTLVNLWHQSGTGNAVLISQQVTSINTPTVSSQIDLGVINSARQDQALGNITANQLAGNIYVQLSVIETFDPGVINTVTGNTEIYPYNWVGASTIDPIFGVIVFQE